jgi:hypothetical protein
MKNIWLTVLDAGKLKKVAPTSWEGLVLYHPMTKGRRVGTHYHEASTDILGPSSQHRCIEDSVLNK